MSDNVELCVNLVAELAELVDALDSDSSVRLEHSGSSPEFRIVGKILLAKYCWQTKYYFAQCYSSIDSGK